MVKLLKNLKAKEWIMLAVCTALIILQVWLDLTLPQYVKKITNLVYTAGSDMGEIWSVGGMMILCAFGSLASAVVICFLASRVSSVLSMRIRANIYNKVNTFGAEEMKRYSTSSLITRTTNDVTQLQMVYSMAFQLLLKAPVMAIGAIMKISDNSWEWSLATVCAVVVLVIMLSVVIFFAVPKFRVVQKLTDKLNSVTRENLEGVRVVRAYNAEEYQEKKFNKANKDLTDTHLHISRVMAIMNPGMTLISNGLTLAIYWIGAYLIARESNFMAQGVILENMVVYISYAMQIVMSFMMLVIIFMILPRAQVSARRINDVLDSDPKIHGGGLKYIQPQRGVVEFKHVSFKYPDAEDYILHDINFTANKGETVAFIGSTGSGKSTLINLIPRLYDATDGEVVIDYVNVKDYSLEDLHNKIGYVSQKAVLFSGTVESNIKFGKSINEIEDNDVQKALDISQAKDFVEKLDGKTKAHVAQMGTNFSGGQKQRLSIARAIAKKPEILVFDDSFSALDYKTDKNLRKVLKEKSSGTTTFIVAQRIGTIMDADKIIVLDGGNVVGIGKHRELLKSCDVYREIALSQLSKEELENA